MEKQLHIGVLLDYYKSLLTDKQAECIELYYNQDLSLYEISQLLDISRQGVRDNIKRGEKQLLVYEQMLSLAGKYEAIEAACDEIEEKLRALKETDKAKEIYDCLKNIRKQIG